MEGSLVIRNNKYQVVFRHNNKQIWRSTGIEATRGNKRKAETEARRIITEYEARDGKNNNILFSDYLSIWLENIQELVKPSTFEEYSRTVNSKAIPYFQEKGYKLNKLKAKYFTDFFKYLKINGKRGGGGLCYKSVKNIRGVMSKVLDTAITDNLITENAVTKSSMPVFENDIKQEIVIYTPDEVKALLKIAKESESHIYIFLLLALNTGARRGELLSLTWNDIDFGNKILTINKSRTGTHRDVTSQVTTPKTQSSNRRIPLSDSTIQALQDERDRQEELKQFLYKDSIKDSDFIVLNQLLKPYINLSAIDRVVARLEKNAGLKHCTIHGFRHTVASILDNNGIPIQDISKMLGHNEVATTERIYIHRHRTARRENIELLEKVYNS